MQKIKVLSEELIGKIAAGEVVENPASVVKELVENAIDASATEIRIEVENGGKKKIRVADNGTGMSAEDAKIAWQRHTTSKISTLDDLFAIKSLGFRGEALASIAAVSRLTIQTKDENSEAGIELKIENQKILSEHPTAMNRGTIITVSDLFYNTPARLKHLKSDRIELLRIVDVVTRYCIAFPRIAFTLSTENGNVLTRKVESDLRAALAPVLGLEIAKSLQALNAKKNNVEITGFISKPEIQKPTSDFIYLYVNKRWFHSKNIINGIREACAPYLMKGKFPVAIIFINLPYEEVDVNVHPAKTEVRFADERTVMDALKLAIYLAYKKLGEQEAIVREVHSSTVQPPLVPAEPKIDAVHEAVVEYASQRQTVSVTEERPIKIRVIGQALNAYIIAEIEGELIVVDQHAACERITYEKLRNFEKVMKQNLIMPVVVELSPKEVKTLTEYRELLSSLGFEIEEFGLRTFTIRSVPAVANAIATKESFREMLGELAEGKVREPEEKIESVLKSIACKASIRSGEPLSVEKMYEILSNLYRCTLPYNCPHGRPTVLRYSKKDLDRMFLR